MHISLLENSIDSHHLSKEYWREVGMSRGLTELKPVQPAMSEGCRELLRLARAKVPKNWKVEDDGIYDEAGRICSLFRVTGETSSQRTGYGVMIDIVAPDGKVEVVPVFETGA